MTTRMGVLTTIGVSPLLEKAIRARLATANVDIVVAGAGGQASGPFLALEQVHWQRAVSTTKAAFLAAQQAVASWLAADRIGRVVFLVPTVTIRPVQGAALSAAVGGFLTTIGQVGAVELATRGITVNTIAHGWIEGEDREEFRDGIPIGRLARPDEIAAAIAFLASEAASYVNGAVLAVDGGFWITKTGGGSPLLRHP